MLVPHLHIFELSKRYYVIDIIHMLFFECDYESYVTLKKMKIEKEFPLNLPFGVRNLFEFINQGYFFSKNKYEMPSMSLHSDFCNISFPPVHRCNYACKYCFADTGEKYKEFIKDFSDDILDDMLKFIYSDFSKDSHKIRYDFVSGGEPLLNFNFIKKFLCKRKKLDDIYNKTSSVFMATNGSLLTEDIVKFLDEHNVDIGISIDGDPSIHNANRVWKDGSGTYTQTINGLTLVQNSTNSNKIKDIWGLTVLTKKHTSIVNILAHLKSLKIKRCQIKFVRSIDKLVGFSLEDYNQLEAMYLELFSLLKAMIKEGNIDTLLMILNENDYFAKHLLTLILRKAKLFRCGAGKNKISICANGDIYPCDSFVGISQFKIGNVNNGIDSNSYGYRILSKITCLETHCGSCWAKIICGGDCYYNSYIHSGEIVKPDPLVCKMNKFFIENAVSLLCMIQQTDMKLLRRLSNFVNLKATV